jgi:hypothetical protein
MSAEVCDFQKKSKALISLCTHHHPVSKTGSLVTYAPLETGAHFLQKLAEKLDPSKCLSSKEHTER